MDQAKKKSILRWLLKNPWVIILFFVIFFYSQRLSYAWSDENANVGEQAAIQEDEVVFVTIHEKHYGDSKNGFDSLMESLESWEFDRRNEVVYFKHEPQLPKNGTTAIVVYDRKADSFERYSDVLNISTLPYIYEFKRKPLVTVHQIDENGTIYLEFKGKRIQLNPGDTYPEWSFEGYQIVQTKIENHGPYKKDQFKEFDQKPIEDKKNMKSKSEDEVETIDEPKEERTKKILGE